MSSASALLPRRLLASYAVLLTALRVDSFARTGAARAACPAGAPIAIVNARVLTMDSERLRPTRAVLVRDGRIAAIDPVSLGADVCRIDGAGQVLLPGLVDMHVHTDERELPLFIANGVTLVREMNGSPMHLALRQRIDDGSLIGPRLLVASPLLAGVPQQFRHRLITTAADAAAAAREYKSAGYDYLKIYDGLSLDAYNALVAASQALSIPLDGHIPKDVGLAHALESGQYLQHMDKIAFALSGHPGDSAKLPELQQLFNRRRAWVTPTMFSLRALDMARTVDYAARLQRPEMAYIDAASLGWWSSLSGTRPAWSPSAFYQFQTAVIKTLRRTDTRFLLGTDAGNPLTLAGFSVHDELATLVADGGFTPYEALLTATRNVGEFLNDPSVGRIDVGARADLVLVERDPLTDLSTLRQPVGVMVRGRWFTRAQLDSLLAAARAR